MRLLRRQNVIKVVTPKGVEDLIKDLLEAPEKLGKNTFVTKLILSASGIDGMEMRDTIFKWLGEYKDPGVIIQEDLKVIEVDEKRTVEELFNSLEKKDSNGETA